MLRLVAQSCLTVATPWTVAHQTPRSMGFYRQEYWSGLPFPSPGDLPNPGIKPRSPALQVDSLDISGKKSTENMEAVQYSGVSELQVVQHHWYQG